MRKRFGYTLVELVTVMAVASVVMAVAVGLLHTLFRFQQGGQERLRQQVALERLARQFREDVHAATGLTAAEVSAGADRQKLPGWRLQLPGGRAVEYSVAGEVLVRSQREGDKPVAWESFSLAADAKVEMGVREDKRPGLAVLRVAPGREASETARPPVLLVEAVLGLDHRFAAPLTNPKSANRSPQ